MASAYLHETATKRRLVAGHARHATREQHSTKTAPTAEGTRRGPRTENRVTRTPHALPLRRSNEAGEPRSEAPGHRGGGRGVPSTQTRGSRIAPPRGPKNAFGRGTKPRRRAADSARKCAEAAGVSLTSTKAARKERERRRNGRKLPRSFLDRHPAATRSSRVRPAGAVPYL